jgi:hypothetical protein
VLRPLKAALGEDVLTPVGEGKVQGYDPVQNTYLILLNGWNAKLYAKGDTFDRVAEGIQDRDGAFGVNWLLRFFRLAPDTVVPRSRSNSVTSGISRSNSITSIISGGQK